jgi:hypothetical protein
MRVGNMTDRSMAYDDARSFRFVVAFEPGLLDELRFAYRKQV